MKKFEVTTFDELAMKDRFYFANNSSHTVWEKIGNQCAAQVGSGIKKYRVDFKDVVFLSSEEDREKK